MIERASYPVCIIKHREKACDKLVGDLYALGEHLIRATFE